MNIAEAKEQIARSVDAYLAQDETGAYLIDPERQRPLFLLGAPGIGKTAIVSQVARELDIGLVSYSMTHHTRQSALGLPVIVHKSYPDGEFDVSEYTMSEIIASVYDHMEETGHTRGILFLDEVNCVSETLYPSMLQFLQFKTFGRHSVPDGWVVVCAGNPPEYNRSVSEFDVVTLDRLRKVAIEPDIGAWLAYAAKTGVHPAVMTYLETKPDHFYSVESTPSGKSFVTARGWDDLSTILKLFEQKDTPVDAALIGQFLQDDEIADRFAQYYVLFSKYRSDYQVLSILAGEAPEGIQTRARGARFDERLALLRLILDALDSRMGQVLEEEQVVSCVRDALREDKEALLEGTTAEDALEARRVQLNSEADSAEKVGRTEPGALRAKRLAARRLGEYLTTCAQEHAEAGKAAWKCLQQAYTSDVASLSHSVEDASSNLDCAFAFIEDVFGDGREMTAFVAELATRPSISRFLAAFGNESYYAHNGRVLLATDEHDLVERMDALDAEQLRRAARAEAAAVTKAGCGSGCGSGCGC